jgi:glyoxalase family protein
MAPGVWHHIAFDAGDDRKGWREYANAGPAAFTQVFDHYIFDSCYSVSPGGLVELCSYGPGFTLDQKLEDLGEGAVSLSPWTEPLRARLEKDLTPIHNPRSRKKAGRAPAKDDAATAPPSASAAEPASVTAGAAN